MHMSIESPAQWDPSQQPIERCDELHRTQLRPPGGMEVDGAEGKLSARGKGSAPPALGMAQERASIGWDA